MKSKIITASQRKFINAALEISDGDDCPEDEKAFLTKHLVQVTLPHRNPGPVPYFRRKNGNIQLTVKPHYETDEETGEDRVLYPYGSIPRLLLYWLTTEALRQKSRKIELTNNVSEFLSVLGLSSATGRGKRGDAKRVRNQMNRLFRASISLEYDIENEFGRGQGHRNMQVASQSMTWWDFKETNQKSLFDSWVELDRDFYEAIINDPIPLDMRALRALKGSALALDLYSWLSYQTFVIGRRKNPKGRTVPWRALQQQLGSEYKDVKEFKRSVKETLRKVQQVYPGLRLGEAVGGFTILPGKPSVLPRK